VLADDGCGCGCGASATPPDASSQVCVAAFMGCRVFGLVPDSRLRNKGSYRPFSLDKTPKKIKMSVHRTFDARD